MVFAFLVPNSIYYNLLYYRFIDNLVIKSKKNSNCFSIIKKNKNTNEKCEYLRDTSYQFLFLFLLNCIKYLKIFRPILDYILILYTMNLFTPFYGI